MKYYPIYLDIHDRSCLVVGGGDVAERKTAALLDAGADITIVSPALTAGLDALVCENKIMHRRKTFEEHDLSGVFLAIAATNNQAVNESVVRACRKAGILVNAATSPAESSFIVPSVVKRGDLMIAVSTCGASPALSRKIREELEHIYGHEYAVLLGKMSTIRTRLMSEISDEAVRRNIFQAIVDSDVLSLLRKGADRKAEQRIEEIIKKHDKR